MEPDQLEVDYVMDQELKQAEKERTAHKKAREPRAAEKKAAASRRCVFTILY